MFSKKFKLKSCNALKSSARKNIAQKLKATYPTMTDDDLASVLPIKSNLTLSKVSTHSNESISIYAVDNVPIILDINDVYCPTIFALWKCPHMVPSVTVNDYLAKRLQEGIYHIKRSHLPPYGSRLPKFPKGAAVSVNTTDNLAPILIGFAQYVSNEMLIVQDGVCISTINILGDFLCCDEKFAKVERPIIEANTEPESAIDVVKPAEDVSVIVEQLDNIEIKADDSDLTSKPDEMQSEMEECDTPIENANSGFPVDMDSILKYCLLSVLKVNGKKLELPLKVNLLYANHMSSFCPPGQTLDVKKSTYKKMSKFLEEMQAEGIIDVKKIEKGVDALTSINFASELIKNHTVIENLECSTPANVNDSAYKAPEVRELFKVTAAVVPLLNLKKGELRPVSFVRECLVNYVKANNLQDVQNKNLVKVDPLLCSLTTADTTIRWDKLVMEVVSKMTPCTQIQHPNGQTVVLTGKLSQIMMRVVSKMGKKVTIISNVDVYGISLTTLSKELQQAVASSCTIKKSLDGKKDEIYVQGDQMHLIARYLVEVYKLPKKFIQDVDKLLAKKK